MRIPDECLTTMYLRLCGVSTRLCLGHARDIRPAPAACRRFCTIAEFSANFSAASFLSAKIASSVMSVGAVLMAPCSVLLCKTCLNS